MNRSLKPDEIERFVADGYVCVEGAFSGETAAACREILWADLGCDRADAATWRKPVVWLGMYGHEPFVRAANAPLLRAAFDGLVGEGRWVPRDSLGTFPVRFPTEADTGDTGWHIDASFPGPDSSATDYLTWRVNLCSRGRALLMLFLFSDVGERDAPTRIRVGSHAAIARMLEPAGDEGVRVTSLDWDATAACPEVTATGAAGTVYLCHPFLVHAAQVNRGTGPRFVAQPPLHARAPYVLDGKDEYVPVERAIRSVLFKAP